MKQTTKERAAWEKQIVKAVVNLDQRVLALERTVLPALRQLTPILRRLAATPRQKKR